MMQMKHYLVLCLLTVVDGKTACVCTTTAATTTTAAATTTACQCPAATTTAAATTKAGTTKAGTTKAGVTTKAGTTKAGATTKAREVVGGSMTVDLGADGPTIMADATKKGKLVTAMQKTVAGLVSGVAEKDVTITLTLARRLQEGRQLAAKKIKVDYSIKLPAGKTAAAASTTITAAKPADIAAKVKSNAAAVGGLPVLAPVVTGVTAAAVTTTKAPEATSDARIAGLGMLIVTLIVSVW